MSRGVQLILNTSVMFEGVAELHTASQYSNMIVPTEPKTKYKEEQRQWNKGFHTQKGALLAQAAIQSMRQRDGKNGGDNQGYTETIQLQ